MHPKRFVSNFWGAVHKQQIGIFCTLSSIV